MLILTLADAHIPDRAIDLPLPFKQLLSVSKNKISEIVLVGNCTKSQDFLSFLKNRVCDNIIPIKGEFDYDQSIPMNNVITRGNFKIGLCSGYTIVPKNDPLCLLTMARQIDTDIIVWGGTHNVEAFTLEDKFFINPGSCTGAFNSDWVWEEEPIDDDTNTNTNITVQQKSDEIEKDTIKEEEEEVKNESVTEEERKSEIEDKSGKDEASTTEQENQNLENTKKDTLSSDSDQKDEDEFENGLSSMPSFCLLDIQNNTCTVYIYTLVDNEVKVDKVKYEKS